MSLHLSKMQVVAFVSMALASRRAATTCPTNRMRVTSNTFAGSTRDGKMYRDQAAPLRIIVSTCIMSGLMEEFRSLPNGMVGL